MSDKKRLLEIARRCAGDRGLVLTEVPGLLGPVVFTPLSACGDVEDGIGIHHTYRNMSGNLTISGGAMSRSNARDLHVWLWEQIERWEAEQL